MKTILSILLTCTLPVLSRAQVPGAQPADAASPIVRPAMHQRQPPPPPGGGFWVVESQSGRKSPVIIHYYTDDLREIRTDTLMGKRLNIHKQTAVAYLNNQLSAALAAPKALAAHQPVQ